MEGAAVGTGPARFPTAVRRSSAGMKILHVSDLHAHGPWYAWLVQKAPKYDLICLTGDLVDFGDVNGASDEQVDTVLNHLTQLQAPYALCSGNHDLIPEPGYDTAQWTEPLRKKNVFLDRSVFWFQDYKFRCVPWCDPVPADAKDDFWLIHAPPYGAHTSIVPGGVSFGCEELRDVCLSGRGPRFALSGHVHESVGYWSMLHHTISLNPGKGNHPTVPNHVVIDMQAQRVTRHQATLAGITSSSFGFPI